LCLGISQVHAAATNIQKDGRMEIFDRRYEEKSLDSCTPHDFK